MIYFVRSGDAVKIGYANEPEKRIPSLRTANPNQLVVLGVVPGGMDTERELHIRFAHRRLRGEWFEICTEILAYLEKNGRPFFLGVKQISVGPPPELWLPIPPDDVILGALFLIGMPILFAQADSLGRFGVLPVEAHVWVFILCVALVPAFALFGLVCGCLAMAHRVSLWLYRRRVRELGAGL